MVVVDPLPVVRYGLNLLLGAREDVEVVAEAGSADEALAAVKHAGRGGRLVVVVGLGLAGEHDSYWLIQRLRSEFPSALILVTGADSGPMEISRSLFVGADGFIDKTCEPESFVRALASVRAGDLVLEGLREIDLGEIARGLEEHRARAGLLSDREREILLLAADGLTARQIGGRLGLSERTVTTHFGRIYAKLGVNSRMSAIRAATRCGVLTAPSFAS